MAVAIKAKRDGVVKLVQVHSGQHLANKDLLARCV